jgi:excisionase family DNA binding protein
MKWSLKEDNNGTFWYQKSATDSAQKVVTVREACRLLNRSRRQVYRYIEDEQITAVRQLLGEWLLDAESVMRLKDSPPKKHPIPARMQCYFPEYEVKELNLGRHSHLVLSRILEHGSLADLKWIRSRLDRKQIVEFLRRDGQRLLSPRAIRFWCLYYGVEYQKAKSRARKIETWRDR